MSCNIVQGYEIACRDSVGGIQEIYVAEFSNLQSYTASSGVITAITKVPGSKFYTFQLEKENATYTNDSVGSLENGTTFFNSSLVFTMKKMSASMKNALKVLSQARLVVIVKDNNGVYFVMGLTRGVDALDIKMTSGKAFGDMNGATVTMSGKEPDFDYTFTGSVQALLS
jgi:hypothetical protein